MTAKTTSETQATGRPTIGARASNVKAEKINPFDKMPTFAVGGEDDIENKRYGMQPGQTLCGRYQGTKIVKGEKLLNGESTLHMLRDENTKLVYGIWGVSYLNAVLARVPQGMYVEITYLGKSRRDTKYGKNQEVHDFEFATENGLPLEERLTSDLEKAEAGALA